VIDHICEPGLCQHGLKPLMAVVGDDPDVGDLAPCGHARRVDTRAQIENCHTVGRIGHWHAEGVPEG